LGSESNFIVRTPPGIIAAYEIGVRLGSDPNFSDTMIREAFER